MNAQYWAVFFVASLSFNYASATFFGRYKGVGDGYDNDNVGYYGWSKGCSCRGILTTRLDGILDRCKAKIKSQYALKSQSIEEYQLKDGRCSGLNKFERRGPYRCSVTRDYARIIFRIGFFRLLINYKLSILDDILSTFLGGFASIFSRFFGRVTDYAFGAFVPDYYVSVVLRQDFNSDGGLYLEGFYPSNIDTINFQDERFGRHSKSLSPYFRPLFDHVLRIVFNSHLQTIFNSHFKTVSVNRNMFSYKYGGRYHGWTRYTGGDGGDASSAGGWGDDTSSSSGGRGDDTSSSSSGGWGDDASSSGGWGGSSSSRTYYTDGDSNSDTYTETYTYTYEEDDDGSSE